MKLIPFDLQRALAGDAVVTRDGRPVLQVLHFDKVPREHLYCVAALVIDNPDEMNEDGSIETFGINGEYELGSENDEDLFMVPKTKTYWANVYQHYADRRGFTIGDSHETEDKAKVCIIGNGNYIKTISFEVNE